MQYTTSELQAWSTVSDFFEPNGVLDEDACNAYYKAHLARPFYASHVKEDETELLYALLKKTSAMPDAGETFSRMYNATRSESQRLQPLLNHMAEAQPDILQRWMKKASLTADITEQILLLRDIKQWLPREDVGDYTSATILKMKPAGFVKKFSPDVADMEHLLAVGQEFRSKPKYEHLGLLMIQGIFIALYGKDREVFDDDQPPSIGASLETKYSSRAAFDLMQRSSIPLTPRELMDLIRIRYRAQALEPDALAYVYESLHESASIEQRTYGLQVLDTVLEAQSKTPTRLYNAGLLHVYSALKNSPETAENDLLLRRIQGAFWHHVANDPTPSRSMPDVLSIAPELVEPWLEAVQKRALDTENQQLLHALYLGGQHKSLLYQNLGSAYFQHPPEVLRLSQERVTGSQLTQGFQELFTSILNEKDSNGHPQSPLYFQQQLNSAMMSFARHGWPKEKLEHLKQSTVIPKWVLTNLCIGATASNTPSLSTSTMPNLEQEPLPLLKKLYPEHNTLWNSMLKAILANSAHNLETYVAQQTQLFNIFSAAFLPGKPTMEDVKLVSEAMGMTPQDYVMTACEHAHALTLPELDSNVFNMEA